MVNQLTVTNSNQIPHEDRKSRCPQFSAGCVKSPDDNSAEHIFGHFTLRYVPPEFVGPSFENSHIFLKNRVLADLKYVAASVARSKCDHHQGLNANSCLYPYFDNTQHILPDLWSGRGQ
jgi:hypothetical protein